MQSTPTHRIATPIVLSLATTALLALSACGTEPSPSSGASTPVQAAGDHDEKTGTVGAGEKEVSSVAPRVLLADASGLTLLDAESGKVLATHEARSFLRLNPAGDGRHVMVSDGDTFRVFDTGIELQAHGDHDHAYTYNPGLTTAPTGHRTPAMWFRTAERPRSSRTATVPSSWSRPPRSPTRRRRWCERRRTRRTTV